MAFESGYRIISDKNLYYQCFLLDTLSIENYLLRDMMKFSQIIDEKLRAESSKEGELGREVLVEVMRVKQRDDKRYYREVKRTREVIRDYLRSKLGRRQYRHGQVFRTELSSKDNEQDC